MVAGTEINGKLASAMRRGDVEGVRALMDAGADPNAEYGEVDFETCSLAHMAVYWDDSIDNEVEIIQVLADSGKVNWDKICGQQDRSVPLYEAVRHNNTAAFNIIYPLTTNFAGLDFRGRDMLFQACSASFADNDHMCAALSTSMGSNGGRRLVEEADELGGRQDQKRRRLESIALDPSAHIDKNAWDPTKLGIFGGGILGSGSVIPEKQREL